MPNPVNSHNVIMPKISVGDLSSDVNNTPTINAQSVKAQSGIKIYNTIEYDVKLHQVKTAIVKYTKVPIKGLKFNRERKRCWHEQLVCDAINQN